MAVFIVLLNSSYGYFKKRIDGTKLTFNVGTLEYELECIDLTNCEVTIPANDSKVIEVKLTSLNTINTKYELYYEVVSPQNTVNIIDGGHLVTDETTTIGEISKNETKNIPLILDNNSDYGVVLKLGVKPSLMNDEAELESMQTSLNKKMYQKIYTYDYDYTGNSQTFIAPQTGYYKLETWGAQGGTYNTTYYGGYGAYSTGYVYLEKDKELYVYVGGKGSFTMVYNNTISGGYNGGGTATGVFSQSSKSIEYRGAGGGATHISLYNDLLKNLDERKSEILIASSGGGGSQYFYYSDYYTHCRGGHGGGITGGTPACDPSNNSVEPATQSDPGVSIYNTNVFTASFGQGGTSFAGGGGGYYGGAGGYIGTGGGSSYIGNDILISKVMYCYDCSESNEKSTMTISTTNISETPISNYAKKDNGYAKITLMRKNINTGYIVLNDDNTGQYVNIPANTSKEINISLINMNQESSYYELYYNIISPTNTMNEIEGGYISTSKNKGKELIAPKEIKNISIVVNNSGNDSIYIKIDAKKSYNLNETELEENEKSLNQEIIQKYYVYDYSGKYETFKASKAGVYKLEAWGAEGGVAKYTTQYNGGKGAYTSGIIELDSGEEIYVYVGGQGASVVGTGSASVTADGKGYNGGGTASFYPSNSTGGGGGGATDFRLVEGEWSNTSSLASRIMVASGGGGAKSHASTPGYSGNGGYGGTLVGGNAQQASNACWAYGTGGTQTSGGKLVTCATDGRTDTSISLFGYGGPTIQNYYTANAVYAGGGGGYYGGGRGYHAAGAGGSSYISGYTGCVGITSQENITPKAGCTDGTEDITCSYHYSGKTFFNTVIKAGNEEIPTHNLTSTQTGNAGNGYARITYLDSN